MIIGVAGLAGSGKDTVADHLVEYHGFVKVALADPLKRICREVFDFSEEQLWGPSEKRNEPDKRYPRPVGYTYPVAPAGAMWVPIGGGHTLINEEDLDEVVARRWCINKKEEGKRTSYVRSTTTSMKLHQLLLGEPPEGQVIDHINGDGLDNRRENLRFCTQGENHANEAKRVGGSSDFKGVSFDASRQKWSAKLMVNGETKNLGRFDREVEAAMAYDKAAFAAFGNHARLNSTLFLTPRRALQQLGTEFGRGCYENVWVDYALRVASRLLTPVGPTMGVYTMQHGLDEDVWDAFRIAHGVVIPDVRFKNEVDAITKAGGKIWRVHRKAAGLAGAAGQHQSEQELDTIPAEQFSIQIYNDGTLDELYSMIDKSIPRT